MHSTNSTKPAIPEYVIRRSERAKRIRLRVLGDGRVEVVAPRRGKLAGIDDFVLQNAAWIRKQQTRFETIRRKKESVGISANGKVLCRGRLVDVEIVDTARPSVRWMEDRFVVGVPDADDAAARLALAAYFRSSAREVFERRVRALNAATGYAWTSIRIADQKTRWGSCSRAGTLSFNWRLLLAPPEVLDYVVIHELAHLKEMNHSARFWALVEAACPDYKRHKAWLREHGAVLVI